MTCFRTLIKVGRLKKIMMKNKCQREIKHIEVWYQYVRKAMPKFPGINIPLLMRIMFGNKDSLLLHPFTSWREGKHELQVGHLNFEGRYI